MIFIDLNRICCNSNEEEEKKEKEEEEKEEKGILKELRTAHAIMGWKDTKWKGKQLKERKYII